MHKAIGPLSEKKENRNLFITVLLNLGIAIAELLGGLLSNSLSLISDAVHNLSDGLAMLITFVTLRVSKRASNERKTFGYKRIQILAALFNAVTLLAICLFLLTEAYERFMVPKLVNSLPVVIVATIGLLANLAGVFLLKDFSRSNLNIKAAYLHLIGDTLSSVAVIVGGIMMYYFQVYWIDPVVTALISLYIIRETYHVLAETYHILMQSTPSHIILDQIRNEVILLKGVKDLHHVHVWSLTDNEIHFEGHIELQDDMYVSESEQLHYDIRDMLLARYGITHVTLQVEKNFCKNTSLIVPLNEC
ncbi:MAG: cation diffusion facilitator family transporter [Bacteroidetes bacterium]|nr:cation diffusion facilitator family transporter [Bacteroidota bacterium]